MFGEGLWAELRRDGVDVLSLVVGATDTPALRASLEKFGVTVDDLAKMAELADAGDVAREGLTHLGDGPTWQVGVPDGAGPSLLGSLPRRQAVELITQGHDVLFGDEELVDQPLAPDSPRRRRRPQINAESRFEERVKPLELFFDLVFVLAFTQCTALMSDDPTWQGVGRAMLVLGVLWWAWVGYAWLTSVVDPEEGGVRIAMFAASACLLVAGLCVPEAFGDRALPFAIAYALVRVGQIVLFLIAARDDADLRRSVLGLAISTAIGVGLLIGAAFVDGDAQWALWIAAIVVDFGGPAVFGIAGWSLVPAHFAERHGLIIILALGESIISLGAGAEVTLSAGVYVAAVLGVGIAASLWWIYFDVVSLMTAQRLMQAEPGGGTEPTGA